MAKSSRNKKKKKRIIVISLLCFAINGYLLYSIGSIFNEAHLKEKEKEKLIVELDNLKEKKEELKVEVNRLQDNEYIARYAREKFLYSGKDEYILKIK